MPKSKINDEKNELNGKLRFYLSGVNFQQTLRTNNYNKNKKIGKSNRFQLCSRKYLLGCGAFVCMVKDSSLEEEDGR
jgi:hypothetical protein